MEYEALKFWLDVGQFVLWATLGAYVWISNRDRADRAALAALEDDTDQRLDGLSTRLTRMETRIDHLPDITEIRRLHERINAVRDELSAVNAGQSGIAEGLAALKQTVQLLVNHHIDRT